MTITPSYISEQTGGILSIVDNDLQMTIPKPNSQIYKTMLVAGRALQIAGTSLSCLGAFTAIFGGLFFVATERTELTIAGVAICFSGIAQQCVGEDLERTQNNLQEFHQETHSMRNIFGTAVSAKTVFEKTFEKTRLRSFYSMTASFLMSDFKYLKIKLAGLI